MSGAGPTTGRPRPQQRRSRVTVERILSAADVEFAAHGSTSTTTTQIAERAGVSVGALYRFFPDKAAIGLALGERYLIDAAERFEPLLASIGRLVELPDGLAPVIAVTADLALDHAGYYQLTREITPDNIDSAGSIVRSTMVAEFEALLRRLGVDVDRAAIRPAVTLVIETVRHTLATCPRQEPERSIIVAELTEMITTYAEHRLRSADLL